MEPSTQPADKKKKPKKKSLAKAKEVKKKPNTIVPTLRNTLMIRDAYEVCWVTFKSIN